MTNLTAKVTELLKRFNIVVKEKSGNENRCLCPMHSDESASFSINRDTGKWICFAGCGQGGLVKLVMKLSKCDYNTAVEEIHGKQHKYNVDIAHKGLKEKYRESTMDLPDEFKRIESSNNCPKYLTNRLKFETVKHFGLGVCEDGYFSDRIIVPVKSKGKEKGFIARDYSGNAAKKYLFPKGFKTKDFLFNLDNVSGDEVILVEGPFDAMAMYERGYPNTVCIFGITVSHRQAEILQEKGIKSVVFCLDNDEGKKQNYGLIAAGDLTKKFKYGFKKVFVMQLPPGRDPDECSRNEIIRAYMYKKIVATRKKIKSIVDNAGNV